MKGTMKTDHNTFSHTGITWCRERERELTNCVTAKFVSGFQTSSKEEGERDSQLS